MTDLPPSPGDIVRCRIKDNLIAYRYADYDVIETFEVICLIEGGFLAKLPPNLFLVNSFLITIEKSRAYSIPKNFIGAEAHFITDSHIISIKQRKNGECCDRCKDFFPYAEKDSEGKFKCFLCSTYRFR